MQKGERPSLAALRPDAPPAVVALVKRAWSQMPSSRPTAAEAATIIGSALAALDSDSAAPELVIVEAEPSTDPGGVDAAGWGLSAPPSAAASTAAVDPS